MQGCVPYASAELVSALRSLFRTTVVKETQLFAELPPDTAKAQEQKQTSDPEGLGKPLRSLDRANYEQKSLGLHFAQSSVLATIVRFELLSIRLRILVAGFSVSKILSFRRFYV
jgi:hypothetical protein